MSSHAVAFPKPNNAYRYLKWMAVAEKKKSKVIH